MDIEKIIHSMTLEEKVRFCTGKDFWHTKAYEHLGIPGVMMCDGPHGLRKQEDDSDHLGINVSVKATCFPTASALASSFDVELLRELGEALGDVCQAEDVAMLLGPGLNIKRSPLCGRNFEYFSEDPYLTGKLGAAYVKGLQSKGIAACVKHYAANNQERRRNSVDAIVDERTLREIYLPGFEAAVKEGKTRSVMCSYNKVNGTYSSENKRLLTDILRTDWGFEGFTVTDWGAVKTRALGIEAGLDLDMPGPGRQHGQVMQALQDGSLKEAALDKAVRNILHFIARYLENRSPSASYSLENGHKLAGRLARESAVLLKNEGAILPLGKQSKLAFIGAFAKEPRYQGAGSSYINAGEVTAALDCAQGLDMRYAQGFVSSDTRTDAQLLAQAVSAAKAADVAVIFAGLPNAFETEGADRDDMKLPQNQNELIAAVAAAQPNTVVVLHGGAPVEMPWAGAVPAILNMYLGGENVGEAEMALLFGDANPSGKLAETYPVKLEDNPSYLNFPGEGNRVEYKEGIYVGYRYYDKKNMPVQYPFGHGLSYTSFEYSDLRLDKQDMKDTDALFVTCKVKNTGKVSGKEAVQLYVRDVESYVSRPVRELKGFAKTSLRPDEEKTLGFSLDKRAFAHYDVANHGWRVESGRFAIELGASSRDIRLVAEVTVKSTDADTVVFTRDSVMEDIMRTEKGREIAEKMIKPAYAKGKAQDEMIAQSVELMGEGSKRMMERMMLEMPISSAVNFGKMTEEELGSLLAALNG